MDSLHILWAQRDAWIEGLINTLIFFSVSSVCAFCLGLLILVLLEGQDNAWRRTLRLFMDAMRMLPFLIYAYVLYYGLPVMGIKLDAWIAGLFALTTYHAVYFAEIFRGARGNLPVGQVEAARAHGYSTWLMTRRILFPQIILGSGPVLVNQLIICLKDTAFLSIITVYELTAVASSIQSTYFMPIQAFMVAVAFYWIVSLVLARIEKKISSIGFIKGVSHEHDKLRG